MRAIGVVASGGLTVQKIRKKPKVPVIASVPIECVFWPEEDGWKGACAELGLTVNRGNFEEAKDPVCNMEVDERSAEFKSQSQARRTISAPRSVRSNSRAGRNNTLLCVEAAEYSRNGYHYEQHCALHDRQDQTAGTNAGARNSDTCV
jgi:hypothetical protein